MFLFKLEILTRNPLDPGENRIGVTKNLLMVVCSQLHDYGRIQVVGSTTGYSAMMWEESGDLLKVVVLCRYFCSCQCTILTLMVFVLFCFSILFSRVYQVISVPFICMVSQIAASSLAILYT